jgi:hypothetical protein
MYYRVSSKFSGEFPRNVANATRPPKSTQQSPDCHKKTKTEKLPTSLEEGLQPGATIIGQYTTLPAHCVVIPGLIEQATSTAHHTRSGLFGGEDQFGNTGVYHSAGAHGAGFKSDVQSRTGQTIITLGPGGITQGNYLGVSRWILRRDNLVPALSQQLTIAHHDGAHRHLTLIGSAVRQCQGPTHPLFVIFDSRHSGYSHSMVAGGLLLIS